VVTVFLYTAGYAAIGFGLLLGGTLWRVLTRRPPPWQPTALDYPLAVFGALLVLSAAVSPYRLLASEVTFMLIVSGAVYYGLFAWLLHRASDGRAILLRAWALGAPPAALVGLIAGAVAHHRASIPHGVGPNGLGTTLLLGSVLALGFAFRAQGRERVLWLGSSLLCLVGLFATGSRASLAGWIVAAVYLAWRELHRHPRRMAAAVATGLAVLRLAGVLAPQLAARLRYTASDVAANRLRIWPKSLEMIRAHPLLGTGFGTFEAAYERVKAPGMSPEPFAFNLALNLAVETGLLGLAGALWVGSAALRVWWRRPHRAPPDTSLRPVIGALWIGLLVDQFADNTLFSISTSAALWLLLALLVSPD